MTSQQTGGLKPTRRTLVKGAAWSVPVVAVAGTAPALAASPPDIINWGASEGCKFSGQSYTDEYCYGYGYVLFGTFENPSETEDLTITVTGIEVGGTSRCIVGLADTAVACSTSLGTQTFVIPAGSTRYIAVYTNASTDSSSTTVEVFFDYALEGDAPQSGSSNSDVGGSPWQGSCDHACSGQNNPPLSACGTPCAFTG